MLQPVVLKRPVAPRLGIVGLVALFIGFLVAREVKELSRVEDYAAESLRS
jgi:hypothetical protein